MMDGREMQRRCEVYYRDELAGILEETPEGYRFTYDSVYRIAGTPIAYRLPTTEESYTFTRFPPVFDNLVSEGWMRRTQAYTQKIAESDRFGLLLDNGLELIGAITVKRITNDG